MKTSLLIFVTILARFPGRCARKQWRCLVLLTALAVCLEARVLAADAAHRLLVKWKDGPQSPAAAAGNAQIGSTVKRSYNAIGWQLVELPAGLSMSEGINAYQALGTVAVVEPDGVVRREPPLPPSETAPTEALALASQPLVPNDPMFSQQWHLSKISATNAWAITTGSTNVVVAVLDTGINYLHEDLAANMWRNPGEVPGNGIDDDGNGFVDDVHGVDTASDGLGNDSDPLDEGVDLGNGRIYHGTICAGHIGAVGNNGRGGAGVNWSVQLMAIRIGTTNDLSYIADTIAGFDYVVLMKRRGVNIRVTSNSTGTNPRSAFSQALKEAIDAAGEEGVLNVFAVGNSSLDADVALRYPAKYDSPSIVTVAASDQSDNLASFSDYGRTSIDLAAPGVDIVGAWGPATNSYVTGKSGGSHACPLVAGAAALLLASNPSLTVNELKAALFGSVDPSAGLKGKVATNGRLNVARALEYLTNANPPAIVITALPGVQRTPTNAPIQVAFNRPMNRVSVESNFLINPPISGAFEWAADSRSFTFRHDGPFDSSTNYTARILGTAQDDAGGTLDGDFDRIHEGSPSDDFVWTFGFPIANDDFASAQLLAGATGSVAANNLYASTELDEPFHTIADDPAHGRTLWYHWSPPEPGGWFTFDLTSGTTFDSLLAIYTGDRLERLLAVTENDNYGTGLGSRVSFAALSGTNYSIAVASKSAGDPNQAGNFRLTWYPTPPPFVTAFGPASAYPGQKVTFNGTNFLGVTRVLFNGVPSVPGYATNAAFLDLTLTATVPSDATTGPITIETPHGNVTTTNNFTVLVRPLLAIRPVPGTNLVELSWPNTSGFTLQRADSPMPGANWTSASIVSTGLTNGVRSAVVTLAPANRFFRLYKP